MAGISALDSPVEVVPVVQQTQAVERRLAPRFAHIRVSQQVIDAIEQPYVGRRSDSDSVFPFRFYAIGVFCRRIRPRVFYEADVLSLPVIPELIDGYVYGRGAEIGGNGGYPGIGIMRAIL